MLRAIHRYLPLLAAALALASAAAPRAPHRPSLVIVSLDGFRADYLGSVATPGLDRVAAAGVKAGSLIPPFPAKTFPSHYTLVTGLHPAHHGIVSNNIYDPRFDAEFSIGDRAEAFRRRWWGGEPVWVTAHRQGLRSASFFWPGTEAEGLHPDEWRAFDGSVPFADRVDQAVAWLTAPEERRVHFVALYVQEPNESGHRDGPHTPGTDAAVREADAAVGRLLEGLERAGRLATTDVVVVSDHGMAAVSPERVVSLAGIDLEGARVLDTGPLLSIWPAPGTTERLYQALARLPHLKVYRRGELPARYHYEGSPRIPPIVGVPDVGWSVLSGGVLEDLNLRFRTRGEHAYDNEAPEMRGIFMARGPSFRSGVSVPEVRAIDVYELLCAALGIAPAPNDGDPSRVAPLLVSPPVTGR